MRSRILATGRYLPEKRVTNDDLAKRFNTSDEWIRERTGIEQRYYVHEEMGASDLALKACEAMFADGAVRREEIDFIIFATLSPDHTFPGPGCFLNAKLRLPGVPAMDIRNQCTGFLYSLSMADLLVKSGKYKRVLVVGAEVHSTGLEYADSGRDVTVLFGDGAGVVVVGPSEDTDRGLLGFALHADGSHAKDLWLDCPGSRYFPVRIDKQMLDEGRHYPQMNGRQVFVNACKYMPWVLGEALQEAELPLQALDWIIPHQANKRINEKIAELIDFPMDRMYSNIERYGNTTAASLPIALDELVRDGKISEGTQIGFVAFGSGFTWGASVLRW